MRQVYHNPKNPTSGDGIPKCWVWDDSAHVGYWLHNTDPNEISARSTLSLDYMIRHGWILYEPDLEMDIGL